MHTPSLLRRHIVRATLILLTGRLCSAQTTEVHRYDLYTGFSDLNTPSLNHVNEMGFHLQAGLNVRSWTALGFDFSTQHGSATLTPGLVTPALQGELAVALPPGYHLGLPLNLSTQTFSAGNQLVVRHFRGVTVFVRPVLAAFHVTAAPHPTDPVNSFVAAAISPRGTLTDWCGAYGLGGGLEVPLTHGIGARVQLDAGWDHPFSNIIANGGWSYRYSVGPAFHFGGNIIHSR